MNDYHDYETKHSYQNDSYEGPDATDPFMEEADGGPVRASGLPPEDYRDELDDFELNDDFIHAAEAGDNAEHPNTNSY